MTVKTSAALILAGTLISSSVSAEMLWSDFSLSYLNGSDYEVGDPDRQVFTVEHASAHNWGDNFFFMDRLHSDNGDTETYFELAPRLSLGYLTGADLSFGPVKDVLIAGTWESNRNEFSGFDNFLTGIGVSLDVPGFQYFGANVYYANNEDQENDKQLTLTWGVPFNVGSAEFLYDGFLDWSSAESDHAAEMNFTSQLKWNAGKVIGTKSPFYVGIEYAYWNNKFGIKGVDERNPSILVKWHF